MNADRGSIRRTLTVIHLLAVLIVALACSSQEQPFPVGDRATATPTPTDSEQAQAAAAATPTLTPVALPTSVVVSNPSSVAPTPAPTATPIPAGQSSGSTTARPSPTPGPRPAATSVPEPGAQSSSSQVSPTRTPVPIPDDYDVFRNGPPSHELIKFAHWDDNRVKLSNWVAGYIVAHGLDHPVRLIETEPEGYKDGLVHADIDIVMEADPAWAQPYVDAGVLVILGALSTASPDTVVVVNASVWQRAPAVGKFLEEYAWDGDVLTAEAGKIKGGRIAIRENVIGLSYLKQSEAVWTAWVDATTTESTKLAIAEGKVSLCREFNIWGGHLTVCKDDPTNVSDRKS